MKKPPWKQRNGLQKWGKKYTNRWLKFKYSEKATIFCESSDLHPRFALCSNCQIYDGDFAKFCGLLKIYELYNGTCTVGEFICLSLFWQEFWSGFLNNFQEILWSSDFSDQNMYYIPHPIKLKIGEVSCFLDRNSSRQPNV